MTKQRPRNTLIGLVHAGAVCMFNDDTTRRNWQEKETGKRSCAIMTDSELQHLVDLLRQQGHLKPSRRRYSPKTRDKQEHQKTPLDKLRALWIGMHKDGLIHDGSERALDKWIARYFKVNSVTWLDSRQEQKAVEMLKKMRARLEGNGP